MAQKDISEKILEAYDDVFADIVNVLLFDGKCVLNPDELEEQAPRSAYKTDGQYREMERDIAKRWKKGNIRVTCIGFENQTQVDADMPLRIVGYDGAEYRAQLNGQRAKRYPVITMVLYFGHRKHWDKPINLIECLEMPEDFRPYVNDYKVNLFEIAFLDRSKVELFKSDFKVVADYFVQMQETGDYIPSTELLDHVQETLALMSVMTDDKRFEDALNSDNADESGKEIKTMCEYLDRVENRGIQKGIQQGRQEGIQEGIEKGKKEMAIMLYENGVIVEVIAKAADQPVEVIEEWLGLVRA